MKTHRLSLLLGASLNVIPPVFVILLSSRRHPAVLYMVIIGFRMKYHRATLYMVDYMIRNEVYINIYLIWN